MHCCVAARGRRFRKRGKGRASLTVARMERSVIRGQPIPMTLRSIPACKAVTSCALLGHVLLSGRLSSTMPPTMMARIGTAAREGCPA